MKIVFQSFPSTKPSAPLPAAPLFSYPYKSPFPPSDPTGPFFSATYKSISAQPLLFHIDPNPPGVSGPRRAVLRDLVSPLECAFTPNRAASPLESASTKNTGVWGYPAASSALSVSLYPEPRGGRSFVPSMVNLIAGVLKSHRTAYDHA